MMAMLATWKWQILSGLMRSMGCWSEGIALGYAQGFDSGVMLDYVYANRPHGRFLVGAAIDWGYLQAIGWRAIRARKQLLQAWLRREVAAAADRGAPVAVLDVAGGPGRYLLELCREWQPSEPAIPSTVMVICRDRDPRGLARGRAQAAAWGLANIRYEQGDAFDPQSLAGVTPPPDLIVVSGLYELFGDAAVIRQSLRNLYALLPPGGRLLFTTQVRHPQLDFIAHVLVNRDGQPWVMGCRSLVEVEGWARAAGFVAIHSEMEPLGLFGLTACRKACGAPAGG